MLEDIDSGTPNAEMMETDPRAWDSLIILQRHSKYENAHLADFDHPTDDEKAVLGHLTEEGRDLTADRTKERVDPLLDSGEPVDFLVLTSPTYWLDHPDLGQRAVETGEVITDVIKQELAAKGLDQARLLNLSPEIRGESTREHKDLEDARFFDQSREFTAFMRQTYGGQGRDFWDNFNKDTHRERREAEGAEGPQELADRVQRSLDLAARFSQYYEHKYPGRKLATFLVSHSGALEAFTHWKLGIPAEDYAADYNDALTIAVHRGAPAETVVNGRKVEVPLR